MKRVKGVPCCNYVKGFQVYVEDVGEYMNGIIIMQYCAVLLKTTGTEYR